jgi:hypothetical protein
MVGRSRSAEALGVAEVTTYAEIMLSHGDNTLAVGDKLRLLLNHGREPWIVAGC